MLISILLQIDSLTYNYNRDAEGNLINNRLNHVRDAIGNSNYSVDIDNQAEGNYGYDSIGNLKKDIAEGIQGIDWTVYGKIKNIDKGTTGIRYSYDPSGNRIVKEVTKGTETTQTFYVWDASGNVMGIYSRKGNNPIHWEEQHLYGSSRLGLWRWDTLVPTAPPVVGTGSSLKDSLAYGSNFLG